MKVNVEMMEINSEGEISFLRTAIRDVTVSVVALRFVQLCLLELGSSQTMITDQSIVRTQTRSYCNFVVEDLVPNRASLLSVQLLTWI
jgi:hypothetical protein